MEHYSAVMKWVETEKKTKQKKNKKKKNNVNKLTRSMEFK